MRVVLEPPLFRHGLAVSALARVSVWHLAVGGGVAVAGRKEPVAVLVHDGTRLIAFDPAGRPMPLSRVEALHPAAAAALAARWQAGRDAAFSGDPG